MEHRQHDSQQPEKQLQLILDNVSDLIAIIDLNGRRLYNSPSYKQVLGDPASLEGTDSFLEIHPDDREWVREVFRETIRSCRGRTIEYRFLRPDGSVRYIESQGNVVRGLDGQPDKVVVVSRDVTERKEAEAKLHEVDQDLQDAQIQLIQSEKLASIGQLAAGMAHEMKNPLGIIAQGVRYFEREIGSESEHTPFLEMMKEATSRADNIIRQVLKFSRPAPLTVKPCAIGQVMHSALDLVGKQLSLKSIRVAQEAPGTLPPVLIDETKMQQVFLNLILNAVQAMPGGGTLSLRCDTRTLMTAGRGVGLRQSDVFRPGDTVLVCEISDTGTGIPNEKLARAFDPFYTTKPPGEGTGLGLSITKTIMDGHYGLIEMKSREGTGTTVTLMLPIVKGGINGQEENPAD